MSKYRIENGTVTMPVKEFNRINDLLSNAEKLVDEVKGGSEVIVFWSTMDGHYHAKGKLAEEIVNSVEKQNKRTYEGLKMQHILEIQEIKMKSVKEFKKWRKS